MQPWVEGPDRERAVRGVLRVLADVAPDRRLPTFDVSGSGATAMAWLGAAFSLAGTEAQRAAMEHGLPPPEGLPDDLAVHERATTGTLDALRRHDAVTPGHDDLRVGWLWVVGTASYGDRDRRFCLPLVSRPASIGGGTPLLRRAVIQARGPWDLWPLLDDGAGLEQTIAWGGGAIDDATGPDLMARLTDLRSWVDTVVTTSGLPPVTGLLPPAGLGDGGKLSDPRKVEGLVAVAGFGLFTGAPVDPTRPRDTLTAWAGAPDVATTALASVYVPRAAPPPPVPRTHDHPPVPLTVAQTEALHHSRTAPVTVVSGPPGTGKSHTAAAIALDAVARGESVLVATRSTTAAEVIAGLLDRMGGPTPVLFGGGQLTSALARKLADGTAGASDTRAAAVLATATARLDELRGAVATELAAVHDAATWHDRLFTLSQWTPLAPHLFEAGSAVDLAEVGRLAHAATATSGLFAGWRRRRAERRLRELVGAPEQVDVDQIVAAADLAALRIRAGRAKTGTELQERQRWNVLADAVVAHQQAWTTALADAVARRPGPAERQAVAALATALRAGRASRRAHLLGIDVPTLTRALPLWVGTLDQVESLLPPVAGEFDLVVLDEASQIDQVAGSAALLRARRAVVVGDPRQLRFVSFVADDTVAEALRSAEDHESGSGPVALPRTLLDVRRVSAFDLAASAAPVTFLNEHFRSVPHLIGFSAERFYEGRLHLATRHPTNEVLQAIDLHRVEGERTDGVNQAEVDAAIQAVHRLADAQPTWTVGVISPYRAQVDAIEAALGAPDHAELVTSGRVKVATVHGFQGAECDAMVASFGVEGAADRGRAFLEDPNLFNVLVTRARQRMVVLATPDDPPPGVFADYLRWSGSPPQPVVDRDPGGPPAAARWTHALAAVLRDAGVATRVGYPVGRWTIDLVVGDGAAAVAVATSVHPDGIDAHVDRHLALARSGWRQAEAFAVEPEADPVAAALALVDLATESR